MTKIHRASTRGRVWTTSGIVLDVALCNRGFDSPQLTTNPDEVTCASCRAITETPQTQAEYQAAEARHDAAWQIERERLANLTDAEWEIENAKRETRLADQEKVLEEILREAAQADAASAAEYQAMLRELSGAQFKPQVVPDNES